MCCRYAAVDHGLDQYLKTINVPAQLQLRVGAQVVLLKNLSPSEGLVNGSRGVVISFKVLEEGDVPALPSNMTVKGQPSKTNELIPLVRFENGAGTEADV